MYALIGTDRISLSSSCRSRQEGQLKLPAILPLSVLLRKGALMVGSSVVLVVEDEWLLRDCIAAHLRAARLHILEARTGEAALALLEARKHIDVLFTDIQLGGAVDGWDVGLKFRKVLPQIPIIYTSGTALRSERAVPTSLFVPKPYEPGTIINACRIVLQAGATLIGQSAVTKSA